MFKAEKRYTIRYSYAGIRQYFDVYEDVDGNINKFGFYPQYAKITDVPDVSHCKTVNDVLDAINPFCHNSAVIHLINGCLPFYYESNKVKDYIKGIENDLKEFIERQCNKFFTTIIVPILIEKDFKISTSHIGAPILIKNYDGEYDNIRDNEDQELEYICYKFAKKLNIYHRESVDLRPEHGGGFYFNGIISILPRVSDEVIEKTGLVIKNENL